MFPTLYFIIVYFYIFFIFILTSPAMTISLFCIITQITLILFLTIIYIIVGIYKKNFEKQMLKQ